MVDLDRGENCRWGCLALSLLVSFGRGAFRLTPRGDCVLIARTLSAVLGVHILWTITPTVLRLSG
jgi:hypothetical protein